MRKDNSTVPACSIFKYAALTLLVCISCLDFQFESEYEDINGLYLEFLTYYQYGGQKLLFRGDTGYISRYDSLLLYNFANIDNVYLFDTYIPLRGHIITDFVLEHDYAYLTLPTGLRIIDISTTQPELAGTLGIEYPEIIEKYNNHLYIAARNNFYITDVTEITNPIQAGSFTFDHLITDLEIDSNFAYVMSGQEMQILNIERPDMPILIYSLSFTDTLPYPRTFSKKGSHLYISARYNMPDSAFLITYDLSINHTLTKVSQMRCPHLIKYINSSSQYMLALSNAATYLINLEYPSRPCFGEMATPGGDYGIIRNNYIYALDSWSLDIFEIRQVE